MFRTNVGRMLGMLAVVAVVVATTGSKASAQMFGRCCGYTYFVAPTHPDPDPVRQVRVIYFSGYYSAWFEVDGVVPQDAAVIGSSSVVSVPRVGAVRGWIVSVYTQPRMNSPYNTESSNANEQKAAPNATPSTSAAAVTPPKSNTADVAVAQVAGNSEPQRSSLSGLVRLWTNKAGTKRAYAELLQIRSDTVLLKEASGTIHEQSFDTLSDADVAFLRAGSLPADHFVSVQR